MKLLMISSVLGIAFLIFYSGLAVQSIHDSETEKKKYGLHQYKHTTVCREEIGRWTNICNELPVEVTEIPVASSPNPPVPDFDSRTLCFPMTDCGRPDCYCHNVGGKKRCWAMSDQCQADRRCCLGRPENQQCDGLVPDFCVEKVQHDLGGVPIARP